MSETKKLIKIIAGCKKSDPASFDMLVEQYASPLYGYFYRLTGNRSDAEDLLGELFLKVTEKIKTCRAESFNSWIFKIASNLFVDYLRAKKRQKKVLDAAVERVGESEAGDEDGSEQMDELTCQIKNLDPATAETILMRYYSKMSFAEIAKIRDEPVGTTLSRVHRGIKKLKKMMKNEK